MTTILTRSEFESKIKALGFSYLHHQAMSGSEYITVNKQRYRISDHYQPSHYTVRNYIDCCSYEDVLKRAKDAHTESLEVNTTDEYVYIEEHDGFIPNPNYKV